MSWLIFLRGSNTTGQVAELLERKWVAFELNREYLAASAFRFMDSATNEELKSIYTEITTGHSAI